MSYPTGALRGYCMPAPPRVTYEYIGDNAGIVLEGNMFHLYGFRDAPVGSTPVVDPDGTLHWKVVSQDFGAIARVIAELEVKVREGGFNVKRQFERLNTLVTQLENAVSWLKIREKTTSNELRSYANVQKLLERRVSNNEEAIDILNAIGTATNYGLAVAENEILRLKSRMSIVETGVSEGTKQLSSLFAQIANKLQSMNIVVSSTVALLPIPGDPTALYSCEDGYIYSWDTATSSYVKYNAAAFTTLYGGSSTYPN